MLHVIILHCNCIAILSCILIYIIVQKAKLVYFIINKYIEANIEIKKKEGPDAKMKVH